MDFGLMNLNNELIKKQAINEIVAENDITEEFGLSLTQAQAIVLVETRSISLKETGRIEFGGGTINKIIKEFCDSPYISSRNYEETLHELIKMFYYYKNETLDLISDDDLISFMNEAFNGDCQGSLTMLQDKALAEMAQNLRNKKPYDWVEDIALDEDEEDEEDEYGQYS